MPVSRVGDIEIEQHPDFQRREWRAQRAGRIVMLLVALGALAGVFGRGPLSHASAEAPNGDFRVEYERFVRRHAPTRLVLRLGPERVREGRATFWLDRDFAERLEFRAYQPEPSSVAVDDDRLLLEFTLAGSDSAVVVIEFEPDRPGRSRGTAGIGDASVALAQFVFP